MLKGYYLEALSRQYEAGCEYDVNMGFVGVGAAVGVSLGTLVAKRFSLWRPWDMRLYMSLARVSGYVNEPSELSCRLHQNLKVEVVGISDEADMSSVEASIALNANAKQFEDYDKQTLKPGSVTIDKSGRLVRTGGTMHGGRAATIGGPSPHLVQPPPNPLADDELACGRPVADWRTKAILRMDVSVSAGSYDVAFRVTGGRGVLLKGAVSSGNLSEAMSMVVHQVFGSSEEGGTLDMMDGVRQLLSGEKAGRVTSAREFAGASSVVHRLGGWSLWVGLFVVALGFYREGWYIGWGYLVAALVIVVLGYVVSAALTPLLEARERVAASRF